MTDTLTEIIFSLQLMLVIFGFNIIGFAFLKLFIKTKFDLGHIFFSQIIGLVIFTYPLFILSSFKILNWNDNFIIKALFIITTIISLLYILNIKTILARIKILFNQILILFNRENKSNFEKTITRRTSFKLINIEFKEDNKVKLFAKIFGLYFLFLLLYYIYLYIRGFHPILFGTEKFMDILMLSQAGKTDYFPPTDGWWSIQKVNYYYYGYILFSVPIKIFNIPYEIGYNLILGYIFAFAGVGAFLIAQKISKNFISGIFAMLMFLLSGNFTYYQCVSENINKSLVENNSSLWSLLWDLLPFSNGQLVENVKNTVNSGCFYPKATRIFEDSYTINEMPAYSFILGDLHPHFMSIVFFVTAFWLLYLIFISKKLSIKLHILFIIILATAALVNFWDFITLGFFYAILFLYKNLRSIRELSVKIFNRCKTIILEISRNNNLSSIFRSRQNLSKLISANIKSNEFVRYFLLSIAALVSPFILYFPFFIHFTSPVKGIGFIPEFTEFFASKYPDLQHPTPFFYSYWGMPILLFVILIIVSILLFIIYRIWNQKILFIIFSFVTIIVLLLFCEYFFFRDLFHALNPPYFRANTVFKLWYHAWMIMSIVLPAFFGIIFEILPKIKYLTHFVFIQVIILCLYLFFAKDFFLNILGFNKNEVFNKNIYIFDSIYFIFILIIITFFSIVVLSTKGKVNLYDDKKVRITTFIFSDLSLSIVASIFFFIHLSYFFIATIQAYNPVFPVSKIENNSVKISIERTSKYGDNQIFIYPIDHTLDGARFILTHEGGKHKDDYEVIKWLNENEKERVVIVESSGGAYTYHGRISAFTGNINILNWPTHQLTWRFKYPDGKKSWYEIRDQHIDGGMSVISEYQKDVEKVYKSDDIEEIKSILKKYNVKYIYIGTLEKETYGIDENKINLLLSLGKKQEYCNSSCQSILIRVNK
ncbi:MAG: DUF2298 domain-containing protein [Candidatus Dojkabacteria bacterium]|nr:DUF2298 domain-containing protein [Candidatus Dojkabacteria bacterium]